MQLTPKTKSKTLKYVGIIHNVSSAHVKPFVFLLSKSQKKSIVKQEYILEVTGLLNRFKDYCRCRAFRKKPFRIRWEWTTYT